MPELPDLSPHGVFDERLREIANDPAAVERALAAGRQALALREPKGDAALVSSTRLALERARSAQ